MMTKYPLMRTQRNQVLRAIEKLGLDLREFEWTEESIDVSCIGGVSGIVSKLVHRPTKYEFCFDLRSELFSVNYSPSFNAPRRQEDCHSLSIVMQHCVEEWLPCLKREIETADLWAEVANARSLTEAATTADDANFTEDQLEQIAKGIARIESWLFDDAQVKQQDREFVTEHLAYLKASAPQQTRRAWLTNVVGVCFTIAVGVGLAPERAYELFRVAGDALIPVIQDVTKLLE